MRLSRFSAIVLVALSCLVVGEAEAKLSRYTRVVAGSVGPQGLFTEAGSEGATLALGDGTRMKLTPGTILRQLPATDLRLGGRGTTHTYVFIVKTGRVDVLAPLKGKSSSAIMLRGPKKLGAIVRHGHATIIGTSAGATVANHDASVLAGLGEKLDPLDPGKVRSVGGDHPGERTLPGRPSWTAGRQLWVTREDVAQVSGASWSAAGATRYEITIRKLGQNTPLHTVQSVGPQLDQPVTLKPGQYSLQVRGFDSDGLGGPPSPPLQVGIVRLQLPPGGYFEPPHSVLLPRGYFADLVGAKGLEMSYRGSKHWAPAASRLWLTRNEPLEVRLRTPGSAESLPLTLAPRGLSAAVALGPKNATWPSVPARIEVRLVNERGDRVPDWIEPKIEARLGTEALNLEWQREGDIVKATVPPRSSGGPWVLRVDVRDQHGIELGRNFLEIAQDQPDKS